MSMLRAPSDTRRSTSAAWSSERTSRWMRSLTDFPSGTWRKRMSGLSPPGSIHHSPSSGPCSSRPSASLQNEATRSGSVQSMTMFCQRSDMTVSLAVDPGAEHRVTDCPNLRGRCVPAQHVLEPARRDTCEVEVATNRLFDAVLPVVGVDEISVDGILDGESKAVRRGRKRRGLDDRRLEILQLGFRVAEHVGLQGHDVETGRPDERLQRQEVGEREDVDTIAEAAQRRSDIEESHDQQPHIGVAGHDLGKRGRHELEVAVVGWRPAEVADAGDAVRGLGRLAGTPYLRGALEIEVVEKVRHDPRRQMRKFLDARREKVVGRYRPVAEPEHCTDSRHGSEPFVE